MKLVDLRPLSETLRVRRLLWLRKQVVWENKHMKPSPCLTAFAVLFEWESEPPVTAEGGLGTSAPALLSWTSNQLVFAPFFLDGRDG